MGGGELREVVRRLRAAVRPGEAGGLADAELLRRWTEGRDEAAFEVLVWRHGPIVLGVCRRLLRDAGEAEDAFQATWLALVRRASSIRRGEAVGSWLYRVACRVALRARSTLARRGTCDASAVEGLPAAPGPDPAWRDLCAVLDEEVNRLPEKYRAPLVLCYFGGRTNEEAARELGRPVGTVVSRLARARQRLRARLSRRGVTLAAGAVAVALAESGAPAAVPGVCVGTAVSAAALVAAGKSVSGAVSSQAAALAEGVVRAMIVTKLKIGAAVVMAAALLGGGGLYTYRSGASEPDTLPKPAKPAGAAAGPVNIKQLLEERELLRAKLEEREQQLRQQMDRVEALTEQLKRMEARLREADDRALAVQKFVEEGVATRKDSPPNADPAAAARGREHAERVQQARDEIELLEVQLEAKQAQFQAAQRGLELTNSLTRSVKEPSEMVQLRREAIERETQVALKAADVKEAKVRLSQSQRRLNALMESAPRQDPNRPATEGRRADLEKRLDALARELEELRRKLPPPP
jgi:RNA polymerase sigma factor (sigma-70 family)